jgi:acid phosphatase (class A)
MRFKYDIAQYEWGKQQRQNPERAAIALRDAVYGIQTIMSEFSIPFGIQISPEGTPAIFRLLRNAAKTCDLICKIPKNHYMRVRPFMLFNEPTFYPKDDEALRKNGSYPSGHTILGWSAALLLSEINPERADTLLARGMMYGESRVIVGAHWQSDVDASKVLVSGAFASLHNDETFLADMKKARAEFKKLSAKKK